MNKEIKAAKRFVRTSLKGNINFEAVANYINKIGYIIYFYNPGEANSLLEKYKVSDFSKTVHAFTIKAKDAKIVFIDKSISAENKLRALLHETAHIVLGHMDISSTIADKRLHDMQAETFAYSILTYKKDYKILYSVICLILTSAISSIVACSLHPKAYLEPLNTVPIVTITIQSTELLTVKESLNCLVRITSSGSKYHGPTCSYVQNKNCTLLTKEKAQKNYEPCKVCNP